MDAHEQFKQTLGEADKEYNAIMALVQEIQRISQQYGIQNALENPYSTLQANVSISVGDVVVVFTIYSRLLV